MSFDSFLAERGLIVDEVQADGRVHRARTHDHPRKKNGAYLWDGVSGWAQNWATDLRAVFFRTERSMSPDELAERELLRKTRKKETERMHARAADKARDLLKRTKTELHPYLAAKGFPNEPGLVLKGKLLVPVWDCTAYGKRLLSVQTIDADGNKLFLKDSRAKGGCFRLGPTSVENWLCEGYATGLSVRAALKHLHRMAAVVVCFNAANLIEVAQHIPGRIVADNDEKGAGEAAALATGQPFVMPPVLGDDFNDYHRRRGVDAAAGLLRIALTNRSPPN